MDEFAALEANLGGCGGFFYLSHSSFVFPSLWEENGMTELLLTGTLSLHPMNKREAIRLLSTLKKTGVS